MTLTPGPARRRRAPTWLWVLVTLFALAFPISLTALHGLSNWSGMPLRIVIDGKEMWSGDVSALVGRHQLAVGAGLMLLAVALLVAVPVVMLFVLLSTATGVVVGLGVPLGVALIVAAVVLSPLVLLAMLIVWLWRRQAPRR